MSTNPEPDEMSLDELRAEIESIDREIVELIARRTYVAETIADVKAERGLPTTDESQANGYSYLYKIEIEVSSRLTLRCTIRRLGSAVGPALP